MTQMCLFKLCKLRKVKRKIIKIFCLNVQPRVRLAFHPAQDPAGANVQEVGVKCSIRITGKGHKT